MDTFDPGSGSQLHDLTPGILPSGAFWVVQIPMRSFRINKDRTFAHLRLKRLPLMDTFEFGGTSPIAAHVNVNVYWHATGDHVARGGGPEADPESPGAFAGRFADARAHGRVAASETGFGMQSGQLTSDTFYANMGDMVNGVFNV